MPQTSKLTPYQIIARRIENSPSELAAEITLRRKKLMLLITRTSPRNYARVMKSQRSNIEFIGMAHTMLAAKKHPVLTPVEV